jgi:hypothetical protein
MAIMIGEHLKRWGVGVGVTCNNPRTAKFPAEGKAETAEAPALTAELLRKWTPQCGCCVYFTRCKCRPRSCLCGWGDILRSKSLACSEWDARLSSAPLRGALQNCHTVMHLWRKWLPSNSEHFYRERDEKSQTWAWRVSVCPSRRNNSNTGTEIFMKYHRTEDFVEDCSHIPVSAERNSNGHYSS